MKTAKMSNSISMFVAFIGAIATAALSVYHGIKLMIKGILSIAGVFSGVKRAHKRIDKLEIKVNELSEVITPMAPQISAIYDHLIVKKGDAK